MAERKSNPWVTRSPAPRRLQLESLQVLAERTPQIPPPQGVFHRGFEKSELVPRVVTRALEAVSVDGTAVQQMLQSIGELDLATRARVDRLQRIENLRRQHVSSDNRQVR